MDEFTDTDGGTSRRDTDASPGERVAELERRLDRKEARIEALERQLSAARDLEALADQLYRAILERATEEGRCDGPGAAGRESARENPDEILLDSLDDADDDSGGDDDPVMTAGDALGGDGLPSPPEPSPTQGTRDPGQDDTATPARKREPDDRGPTDPDLVRRLRREIESLSVVEREMLRHYRAHGPTPPPAAHQAVGGSGDRTAAYAANRALRTRGLVEHAERGRHRYALPSLVEEAITDPLSADAEPAPTERDRLLQAVEASFVHDVRHPSEEPDPEATNGPGFGDDIGAWPDA